MNSHEHKIVKLTKITDGRGNLTFVEGERHLPFKIKRIYYIYDVPENQSRGKHAHKKLHQFIIAIKGNFSVFLDDGKGKQTEYVLDKPNVGLYVAPMVWRELRNFSRDAVCLCLVSEYYISRDYIRNYRHFKKAAKEHV